MARIESIQLIEIDRSDKFVFGQDALKKLHELLLSDDMKDRSIVIISVTGAFRTGKSFLLSFFLKYLNFMYSKKNASSKGESWLGDENVPLEGFVWKSGEERITTGIQMWPEIFHATLSSGEKVGIVLLDTQGLFDTVTTVEANTKIFALSTMLSSMNIYNLSPRIQEDMLQFLKFFTDYGSEAVRVRGNQSQPPFGKLLFLVRDWSSPREFPYGYAGSRKMLDSVLEVKADQQPELQSVRRLIKSAFSDIEAFLMPHPGLNVTGEDSGFDGRLSDIRKLFKDYLNELVPSVLSPEQLIPKKIEGRKVSATELSQYFTLYVNKLNSDEMPTPRGIFEANAEMSYRLAFEDALGEYQRPMEILCRNEKAIKWDIFAERHEEYSKSSRTRFSDYPKFHDVNFFAVYETKLNEEIHRLNDSYKRNNQEREKMDTLKNHINDQDDKMDSLRTKVDDMQTDAAVKQRSINEMHHQHADEIRSMYQRNEAENRAREAKREKEIEEERKRARESEEKWRQEYRAEMNRRQRNNVIGQIIGGIATVLSLFGGKKEEPKF